MPHRRVASLLLAVGLMVFAFTPSVSLHGADAPKADSIWAHWRGPTGQGYSTDARVPLTWGDKENLLWKVELPGRGNSTPIVWGDRIFLTSASADGDERYVLCVRASDGKLLWKQTASKGALAGKTHAWNGYASSSCATDGTHVFAFFGTPGLFCYDMDGKLLWKQTFGIFTASTGWGTGASPFIFEDLVIMNCDNDGAAALPAGHKPEEAAPMSLIALDKKTGEVKWKTPRNQGKGWSTPLLIPMSKDRTDLVLNGPHGVWGYDPRTGKEIWHCVRHKGDEDALFGEPVPVFNKDTLFAASGRPGPFQAIRLNGTGDVTKTHVTWDVKRKGSRDVGSPILWNDVVYVGDRTGYLSGHDVKTGQQLFRERTSNRSFSASPVAARGKLFFLLEDGQTIVLDPAREFKLVGKNKLTDAGEFRASPAIADGKLYLRSQTHLYSIGEK
ncbi:MAG: PQQ-binding-like beta-propeller repeat protein [Gemmataceae bacterium]|nr:PQQ-binding-like beta-propeller repeat protein [Gemmataceae bacterium]